MRWNRTSDSASKGIPSTDPRGRHWKSQNMLKGCMPFLPTWSMCKRVDLEQRAQFPWLTASCDVHDSAGDVFASVRRHCGSQTSRSQMSSSQGSVSSRAQVKPTLLDPEDLPVMQPLPPTDDDVPPMDTAHAPGVRLTDATASAPPPPADDFIGFPSLRPGDLCAAPSQPPAEEPSGSTALVIRPSGSQMVNPRTQVLELSSSRFTRPNQDSQFNLLYGADGRPPLPHKSMKLVVKHDRKRTWPSPAPVFDSSTLYMTRRKNKYPNCQIQIQTARPEASVSKSSRSKWELEMKRAESNIRRSLSLECLGKPEGGQPVGQNVEQNDTNGPAHEAHLGGKPSVRDAHGEAPQLYKRWNGPRNPKTLHTLLAAMEFGAAMASVRCDKALPQDEKLIHIGRNNILLQMGTSDRTIHPTGKTPRGKNFDGSCVEQSDTDSVLTLHCGAAQKRYIRQLASSSQGQTAE